jgi:hypothetical protein
MRDGCTQGADADVGAHDPRHAENHADCTQDHQNQAKNAFQERHAILLFSAHLASTALALPATRRIFLPFFA